MNKRYRQESVKTSIKVCAELPEGYEENNGALQWMAGYREARSGLKFMYHCPQCKGWIEGHPVEDYVNTLRPSHLSGRSGTTYNCRRCDYELAFLGMVS